MHSTDRATKGPLSEAQSERPRWSLICCYNAAHNDPYKDSHHPRYTRLEKLPDDALKLAPRSPAPERAFVDPKHDRTIDP